ncbi:MAG: Hsp20/alpha crystallin family protein [Pseudomonadota bacterium]
MAMVQYDPWGVGQLQSEINRLFRSLGDTDSTSATAGWVPPVDIHEFKDRFQLFVDLPGISPADVEITLENGVLSVSGERARTAVAEGDQRVERRTERGAGRFYRRFILPDTVDADNVHAAGSNGVLEITIPKQAKAKPRRITVAA